MLPLDQNRSRLLSQTALLATVLMTGVHHVYRLGPELILPVLAGVALPLVLLYLLDRTGKRGFAIAYAIYVGLVVFWFGFLDGFLDHVFKAAGIENITFLPGSEAAVVATYFRIGSPHVSYWIYEGTGILSAALAIITSLATAPFIAQLFGGKAEAA